MICFSPATQHLSGPVAQPGSVLRSSVEQSQPARAVSHPLCWNPRCTPSESSLGSHPVTVRFLFFTSLRGTRTNMILSKDDPLQSEWTHLQYEGVAAVRLIQEPVR